MSRLTPFALLLAVAACSSPVGERPEDVRDITDDFVRITTPIEYTDDTIFPEEDPRLIATEVERERIVFEYDGVPTTTLEAGHVLVGGIEDDQPYLRRVLSVESAGSTVTAHTRDALPEEAIQNGAWSYSIGQPYGEEALGQAVEEGRFDELLDEAAASRAAGLVGGRSDALGDGEVGSVQQAARIPASRSLVKAIEGSTIECRYEGRNFTTGIDVSVERGIDVDSSVRNGDRVDSVDAHFNLVYELDTQGHIAAGAECAREIESRNFIPYRFRSGLVTVAGIPIWFDMKAVAYAKVAIKLRVGEVERNSKATYVYSVNYSSRTSTPTEPTCIIDLEEAERRGRDAARREECEPVTECEASCSPDFCTADDVACGGICCGAETPAVEPLYMDIPVMEIDNTYVCNYNRFIEVPCSTADALGVEYRRQDGSRGVAASSEETWDWDVTHSLSPRRAEMDSGRGVTMDFEVEGGVLFELMLYRILYFEMKVGPKVGTTITWNRDACELNSTSEADLGVNVEVGLREPLFLSDLAKWEYRLGLLSTGARNRSWRPEGCRPRTSVSCDRHTDCTACAQQDGCSWVSDADVVDVDSRAAGGSCMADHEAPSPASRSHWVASNVNLCKNCAAHDTWSGCFADSGFCGRCDDSSSPYNGMCINHSTHSPHVNGWAACGTVRGE